MSVATITVQRDAGFWVDRLRAYRVVLDGETVARVKRGESFTLATDAGSHRLHLAIDWTRSEILELDLEVDEELHLRCWPRARGWSVLFWITIGRARYIGLERQSL